MRKLIDFFLRRKLLVNLTVVIVFVWGVLSLTGIRREGIPSVEIPVMYITTVYPGASPENVELKVTIPLEDEIYGISGVDQLTSISREGISTVVVQFDDSLSEKKYRDAKDDVQKAIDRVRDLPAEVTEKPSIMEIKTELFPILEIALSGEDQEQLREYVQVLERKILRTKGVSTIYRIGYPEKEVTISVDPNKLITTETAITDVLRALQARNIRMSGGTLESFGNERSVIAVEEFRNPDQVARVIIRSNFAGNALRVKDVADVKEGYEEKTLLARSNGRSSISLCVVKKEMDDVIRTISAIEEVLKSEKIPEGIEYALVNDISTYTKNRLNIVQNNALIGMMLVFLVLMTFMNFRTAAWTAFGIPFSFLLAFTFIPKLDITLNVISLAGLLLVVGMLVDDAIVVAENIQRHKEMGEDCEDGVLNAVMEIIGPLSTTIATTIIAFAPLLFISGTMGKFIFQLPAVVIALLVASYLESILILPSHLSHCRQANQDDDQKCETDYSKKNTDDGNHQPKKIVVWLRKKYKNGLTRVLNWRYLVIVVAIAVLLGTLFFAVKKIPFLFAPEEGATEFYIKLHAPKGSSLEKTTRLTNDIEKVVLSLPKEELDSMSSRVGNDSELYWYDLGSNPNYSILYVYLTSLEERDRTMTEIIDDIKERIKPFEQNFDEIIFQRGSNGPAAGAAAGAAIDIRILTDNDAVRREAANKVKDFLANIDGVYDINDDIEVGKDEIRIEFDYDKIARLGVSVENVASTLRMAYTGLELASVRDGYDDVSYRIRMGERFRGDIKYLLNLPVRNSQGQLIRLNKFARLKYQESEAAITRYDRLQTITITAEVDTDKTTGFKVKLAGEKFARQLENEYTGVFVEFKGEGEATQESLQDLLQLFMIAIIGIYFLLVLLFNSFLQPIFVMSAIPFSAIGMILAFALHNDPLTMQALIGFVGLSGVVVNDSLIMVSYINGHTKEYADFKDAVINGAVTRLRPIILTTITTVAGVIPLIYGWGGTDEYIKPMAMTLGYGLLGATMITLFLVPSLLLISVDFQGLLLKGKLKIKKLFRK